MPKLRLVHRRIELDQHVAGLDALPIADMDGANNAGLERLDHFGPAARNDLAGCGGNDVDLPEARPGQRQAEQSDDRQTDRAADGRWRRLDDLERRRKEGEMVPVALGFPRKRDDVLSGLHGFLLAGGRVTHSDHRS